MISTFKETETGRRSCVTSSVQGTQLRWGRAGLEPSPALKPEPLAPLFDAVLFCVTPGSPTQADSPSLVTGSLPLILHHNAHVLKGPINAGRSAAFLSSAPHRSTN